MVYLQKYTFKSLNRLCYSALINHRSIVNLILRYTNKNL